MMPEVADDGFPFRLRQRREPSLADELFHLGQDVLPFSHGPEAWVWHPMATHVGRSVACAATPCIDPSIGSLEVRNSSEHRAA